jgi:hypothetical protein
MKDVKAFEAALEATIRFYPRYYTWMTMGRMTSVESPTTDGRAPINRVGRMTRPAGPDFRHVVKPSRDTLCCVAWIDLSKEPLILKLPDTGDRYHVAQLMDQWTEVIDNIGTRKRGQAGGLFGLVGPDWQGELPEDISAIRAPDNLAFLAMHVLVKDEKDVPEVLKLLQRTTLTPLGEFRHTGPREVEDVGVEMPLPPTSLRLLTNEMTRWDPLRFLGLVVEAMEDPRTRATKDDLKLLAELKEFLEKARGEVEAGTCAQSTAAYLAIGVKEARQMIDLKYFSEVDKQNGWVRLPKAGRYGDDHLARAAVAEYALFANVEEESLHFDRSRDDWGMLLEGSTRYVLHFDKDKLPPVDAFWSVAVYDAERHLMVENPIDRYAIGDRMPGLKYNADGSLDIFIQHMQPVEGDSNWLPAPEGRFFITLRAYLPRESLLTGEYKPPQVRIVGVEKRRLYSRLPKAA